MYFYRKKIVCGNRGKSHLDLVYNGQIINHINSENLDLAASKLFILPPDILELLHNCFNVS